MNKLYIAYGSNLNKNQMRGRCPGARILEKGTLKDYELLFKGDPGLSYLTVEPKEGEEVPIVVWAITPEDEVALDRYEGYPRLYQKEQLQVELETGEKVEAMAYIMTNERPDLNPPSTRYLETVRGGYRDFGINENTLFLALKKSIPGPTEGPHRQQK